MKKIKIIDLLNKVANGEEVPKRIKYENETRIYNENDRLGTEQIPNFIYFMVF